MRVIISKREKKYLP